MLPKKREEALTTQTNKAPLARIPEGPIGQENIEPEDLVIPRIRLLQPLSKEVVERKSEAGHFAISITGEILPKLQILFFYHTKSRVCFARAIDKAAGEGVACISMDAKLGSRGENCAECALSMWDDTVKVADRVKGQKTSGPECNLCFNYPCFVLNSQNPDMPVALSVMRTSLKIGREINSFIRLCRAQWWTKVFEVYSELRKGEKGSYYVFAYKELRKATEEEQGKAFSMYQGLIGKRVVVPQDQSDGFEHQ